MASTDSFCAGFDEAASVDDEDFGFIGARRQFITSARENAHHDLAVDEVFGASETDETDFSHKL